MNIFTKVDGTSSVANILNVLVLIASILGAVFPIWESFIPANIVPYIVGAIATLNVVIRILSTGAPIVGGNAVRSLFGKPKG